VENLELYKKLMRFLALYLGNNVEILLCDTEKILHTENPFSSRHHAGEPLGDVEKSFIENQVYADIEYTINYRSLTPHGEKLRSATLFIKDDNGELQGMLTINGQVTELLEVRRIIDSMINGERRINAVNSEEKPKTADYYEIHTLSVGELIQSVIDEAVSQYGVPPQRWTPEERLEITRRLDDKGVFLIKGSIAEVAKRLHCSEATIYRYLQQING